MHTDFDGVMPVAERPLPRPVSFVDAQARDRTADAWRRMQAALDQRIAERQAREAELIKIATSNGHDSGFRDGFMRGMHRGMLSGGLGVVMLVAIGASLMSCAS